MKKKKSFQMIKYQICKHVNSYSHVLLQAFVDLWLDKFDSIGSAGSRKLSALALCILLQLPAPWLLQRLTPIFAHITSVWYQVRGKLLLHSMLSQPSRSMCVCKLTHGWRESTCGRFFSVGSNVVSVLCTGGGLTDRWAVVWVRLLQLREARR